MIPPSRIFMGEGVFIGLEISLGQGVCAVGSVKKIQKGTNFILFVVVVFAGV